MWSFSSLLNSIASVLDRNSVSPGTHNQVTWTRMQNKNKKNVIRTSPTNLLTNTTRSCHKLLNLITDELFEGLPLTSDSAFLLSVNPLEVFDHLITTPKEKIIMKIGSSCSGLSSYWSASIFFFPCPFHFLLHPSPQCPLPPRPPSASMLTEHPYSDCLQGATFPALSFGTMYSSTNLISLNRC